MVRSYSSDSEIIVVKCGVFPESISEMLFFCSPALLIHCAHWGTAGNAENIQTPDLESFQNLTKNYERKIGRNGFETINN